MSIFLFCSDHSAIHKVVKKQKATLDQQNATNKLERVQQKATGV